MTQEEKAKAYDELFVKANRIYNKENDVLILHTIEDLFPELAESDDERIRKAISQCIEDMRGQFEKLYNVHHKDAIAWLEKQKTVDVLDEKEREFADNVDSYRKEIDAEYQKSYNEGVRATLEKQGGQKPADKVEPKFHEGDWAVSNLDGKARKISKVHFDEYNSYYVVDGKSVNLEEYDRLHHLWTIQDAKDGDVLAVEKDKTPFIFKGFDKFHPECPVAYCGIDEDGIFIFNSGDGWWTAEKVGPATKEQCDLLFQKMKDLGYEWDKQEKRPIKVPKTKEETGVLKQLIDEGNPALSEEDEKMFRSLHNLIYVVRDNDCESSKKKEFSDWLKSLKDRVQPKQEWSEEDDYTLNETIQHLEELIRIDKAKHCSVDVQYYQRDIDWLKSLRHQRLWKPSDEQIKAIRLARSFVTDDFSDNPTLSEILMELEEQLQKIKKNKL